MRIGDTSRATRFCLALAVYFGITGVWGLFSHTVLGAFTTNRVHAIIELVLAAAAVACCRTRRRDSYLTFVGVLLIAVGVLRFVPFTAVLIITILNVNPPLAVANLVIGAAALTVSMERRRPTP